MNYHDLNKELIKYNKKLEKLERIFESEREAIKNTISQIEKEMAAQQGRPSQIS